MRRKLIKFGVITAVLLAIVVTTFIAIHNWMNSGANGTVHTGTPTAHKPETIPQTTPPIQLDTPYFNASLPSSFVVKRQNTLTNGGPILFQLSANTDGKTDQQFGATIGTIPAEGFSGVGDYKLRTTNTVTYAKYTFDSLPAGAIAFHTISGSAELTVFWPHGERYAELSFSTDGLASPHALESSLSGVIASWNWK